MVTRSTYNRLSLKRIKGMKVRTTRAMRNSQMQIPAGTIMEIIGKNRGYTLQGWPCQHCGIAPIISKVDFYAVEFVEGEGA